MLTTMATVVIPVIVPAAGAAHLAAPDIWQLLALLSLVPWWFVSLYASEHPRALTISLVLLIPWLVFLIPVSCWLAKP